MAKFITINRKYLWYGALAIFIVFISFIGANIWKSSQVSLPTDKVDPELKIVSVDFEPGIILKDITYNGQLYKGLQTIPAKNFKVSAIIQNMTSKTMSNIPVKLSINLIEGKTKRISKVGNIPTLEPGATAKIGFENITALGDAKGQSATAGQHEMILAILANPSGGVIQNTEARIIFNVDSSLK